MIDARRSQRVVARIRIQVRKRAEGDSFISEIGHTLVVNAHGALIHLVMKVQVNELLVIKHLHSGEERHGRVVRIDKKATTNNEVAIEFTEVAPRFWHIDFPPADWTQLDV